MDEFTEYLPETLETPDFLPPGSPYSAMSEGAGMMEPAPAPEPVDSSLVLQQVTERHSKAREAHDRHLDVWRLNRQRYHGVYDDLMEGKADWQSRTVLPKVARDVDWIASSLTAALNDQQEELFALEPQGEGGEVAAPVLAALIRANLDRERFDEAFEGAVRNGLLTSGMLFKVYPDPNGPWTGYCKVVPLPMERYYRDPTGRNRCRWCLTPYDYADVETIARERGWDLAALESVKGQAVSEDERRWRVEAGKTLGLDLSEDGYRSTVFLLEYEGPIYDGDRNEVSPLEYVVIANRTALLYRSDTDPMRERGSPWVSVFVDGDICHDPFAVYGKSYVADGRGVAESQTRLHNVIMDQLGLNVPMLQVHLDGLMTGEEKKLKQGVPGGQILLTTSPNPAVTPVSLSAYHPETLAVAQYLDAERQEASGATEVARGIAPGDGSPDMTATEFQGKVQSASSSVNAIAAGIEKRVLVPLVERMLAHLQPELDLMNPAAQAVAADAVAEVSQGAPPVLAIGAIQEAAALPFSVRVRGISAVLGRQQQQAALMRHVEMAMALPGGPLTIDVPKVLRLDARLAGLDFEDMHVEQAEQAWLIGTAQQMAAEMASQAMGEYDQQQQAAAMPQGPAREGETESELTRHSHTTGPRPAGRERG